MPKKIFLSSYQRDCGHQSHFLENTLREKFNTYRLADYKEHVIDLLRRVCTVSAETMNGSGQMRR